MQETMQKIAQVFQRNIGNVLTQDLCNGMIHAVAETLKQNQEKEKDE